MITLLARLFIKGDDNRVRRRSYGILCSVVGIILNLLLCLTKFFASFLTSSVSIAADALNNLSDAGSSVVTLIGFKLAGQNPDPDHPFGHGRMEYLSGFLVSLMILLMGFELGKTSIKKIFEGAGTTFHLASVIILCLSIAVKFYMYCYNTRLGKRFDSAAMKATGTDSLGDCLSTCIVFACSVASRFTSLPLDGWCGLAVALFILWSGIKSAKETINPILGTPPDRELVEQIEKIVLSYPNVCGIHDLIVHNYGPGRVMISLHAEVPQTANILTIHDCIDNIEQHLSTELNCHAVIHMDPIAVNDEKTMAVRHQVSELAKAIDPRITIHDFRMVIGDSHTNLIFDMAVPFSLDRSDDEILREMERLITVINSTYKVVIVIDKVY